MTCAPRILADPLDKSSPRGSAVAPDPRDDLGAAHGARDFVIDARGRRGYDLGDGRAALHLPRQVLEESIKTPDNCRQSGAARP